MANNLSNDARGEAHVICRWGQDFGWGLKLASLGPKEFEKLKDYPNWWS
jgi:hypothetical protein